jgi:biofilm PGA synthesis N-glycosyltransferase PgaC
MLFVIWHLLFPWTDLAFTLGFVPGVLLSIAYSSHLLMGPMVLALLPAALLLNLVIFFVMRSMFNDHGLKIRRNVRGLLVYVFGYSLLLQPARVVGYFAGLLRRSPKASAETQ